MKYNLKELVASMWEHREKKDFRRRDLETTYRGLSVKASIGMTGNISKIPWISFCADGQETQKGIYPVLLFYGTPEFVQKNRNKEKVRKIVLAYGVSANKKPDILWGTVVDGKKTIKEVFKEWNYNTSDAGIKKYNSSYVYQIYEWTDNVNYALIQNDIDKLIDTYLRLLGCDTHNSNFDVITEITKETQNLALEPFSIQKIISHIKDTGLLYSPSIIKRFAFSLMSKRFLILSGLAGSGKTQLALAFASALVENKDKQMCVVSVGADWTNREPLLGFPNALQQDKYVKPESGVLDLLIEANREENANKPFFLILDEMNMSYVERYFADFLSAMESKERISLWNSGTDSNKVIDGVPQRIDLPKNLFIIGTINVDETTYMFSPKVLDRANVIEFKISSKEMGEFLQGMREIDRDNIISKAAEMGADFVAKACKKNLAQNGEAVKMLQQFFDELKNVNAEFGYRSATEIFRFICQAKANDDTDKKMSDEDILDAAIVQKLLPKLHGSRKKLEPVLAKLWKLCFTGADKDLNIAKENSEKALYKESADKIRRMYESAIANGFTSFAEA